jgi:[acyl-carrier-protein] S-malonyltransferase
MCAAFFLGYRSGACIVEQIEEAISSNIRALITEGPIEELTKTENAQPAIFAASMACFHVLVEEYGIPMSNVRFIAGHSLGEYTALCASRAIALPKAAQLVKFRGEIMAKAYPSNDAIMVAVLGLSLDTVENIVADYQDGRHICVVANDNAVGQIVLSGHERAVNAVCKIAMNRGAKKTIKLATSGPFHSPLMAAAAIDLDKFLTKDVFFSDPMVPIIMNISAKPVYDHESISENIVAQMTGRLRWRETMDFLHKQGVQKVAEIGPGRVLTGLLRRTYGDISCWSVDTVTEMDSFVKSLENYRVA